HALRTLRVGPEEIAQGRRQKGVAACGEGAPGARLQEVVHCESGVKKCRAGKCSVDRSPVMMLQTAPGAVCTVCAGRDQQALLYTRASRIHVRCAKACRSTSRIR